MLPHIHIVQIGKPTAARLEPGSQVDNYFVIQTMPQSRFEDNATRSSRHDRFRTMLPTSIWNAVSCGNFVGESFRSEPDRERRCPQVLEIQAMLRPSHVVISHLIIAIVLAGQAEQHLRRKQPPDGTWVRYVVCLNDLRHALLNHVRQKPSSFIRTTR
jgi:hypothetical protein